MEVVGSEIGQKMRSAIKAKLTELGCYVDDELPDYVMVMVANKRTRTQMEDDLQLFLVDNTKLFVNWLHQVLKKLQEVTVTTPIKLSDTETSKEPIRLKEHKSKDKKSKDKLKKTEMKKAKKKEKDKVKQHRKKEDKKGHKSKKKSKHHDMIRPNIPPLLMNMEKVSEPSITDVFAGQILKSHGFTLDDAKDDTNIVEKKPVVTEAKRPIRPIIDPATIPSHSGPTTLEENKSVSDNIEKVSVCETREEQIEEMNVIEAKIQGLKQKLTDQTDTMSEDDEDYLNIRTEADELMNDFAEDVFQETSQASIATPPIIPKSPVIPPPRPTTPAHTPDIIPKEPIETLPQIELKLPKRPQRERREEQKPDEKKSGKTIKALAKSPERFTPERAPTVQPQAKSAKSRLGRQREKTNAASDKAAGKSESSCKRLDSRVSVLESKSSRSICASVVRVRPRPRVQAPSSSLLMKAMADAHKSLLNIPPKIDTESQVKRALVLPIRRSVDAQNIVIQVPVSDNSQADDTEADRQGEDSISLGEMDSDDDKMFRETNEYEEKEEYIPTSITKKITNNEYVPSKRNEGRKASKKDDTLIIETINIHNPTVDKDKSTQFIVTMDGYHPNAFLAKKLLNEGIIKTEDELSQPQNTKDKESTKEKVPEKDEEPREKLNDAQKKSINNTSDESCTQVSIKTEVDTNEISNETELVVKVEEETMPSAKKRKASPIIFDIVKKDREPERVKTESVSSDSHMTISTTPNTHKYDSVPPLSQSERKPAAVWCRAFPLCRYGSACAFLHPRCKFAAACSRRDCVYSHGHGHGHGHANVTSAVQVPVLASHVVPAANYKSISTVAIPGMCKYYPSCVNPACHYYHPKPCRYGKNCTNKLECNFYHIDVPGKWRSSY